MRTDVPAIRSMSSGRELVKSLEHAPPARLARVQPPTWPKPWGKATVPGPTSSETEIGVVMLPAVDSITLSSPSAAPMASASLGCTTGGVGDLRHWNHRFDVATR